jgi:hypothetical protein
VAGNGARKAILSAREPFRGGTIKSTGDYHLEIAACQKDATGKVNASVFPDFSAEATRCQSCSNWSPNCNAPRTGPRFPG